jgi:hypothetical protein
VVAAATVGCGPRAFIEYTVDATLQSDQAIESLVLTITPATDTTTAIFERSYELTERHTFPVVIVLEPDASTPRSLSATVLAYRGDDPVASGGVDHRWREDRVSEVQLTIVGF